MTKEEKSGWQMFIDGDLDGLPVDMDKVRACSYDLSEDDFDYTKKCGLTDNLYIAIGIDLRWLKRFNPKGRIIF